MLKVTFEYPDDILQILSETPEQFAEQGRMLIAVKLFELGRLSSGQAAGLCWSGCSGAGAS